MQRDVDNFLGQFSSLVHNVEHRVDDLVAQAKVDRQLTQVKPLEADAEWTAKQNSLSALKSDWTKVKNMAKCLDRQLEHQSNYHLFFQTLKEYQTTLEASFAGFRDELAGQRFTGIKEEAKWLFDQMQRLITTVLQWWQRIDSLIIQSRKVLPMSVRLGPLEMKRPGKVLVDIEAQGLTLKANDDVFVVSTDDRDAWELETTRGRSVTVPSMCVAISGPDPEAMERALSVRTLLLADWTSTLKEVGRSLVSFTLSAFRQMNTAEVDVANEASLDGRELQPLLRIMEKLLQTYWTKHPEFGDMAERISKARISLAIFEDAEDIDDYTHIDINTLFLQLSPVAMPGSESDEPVHEHDSQVTQKMLTLLMRKYQELLKYWEVYKVLVETSNDPNYFWMMEEFQKLRYINVTELLNFLASEDKETWLRYIHQMMAKSGRRIAEPVVTPATLEQDLDLRPDSLRLADPGMAGSSAEPRVLIDVNGRQTFVQSEQQPQVGVEVTAELINVDSVDAADHPDGTEQTTFTSTTSLMVNAEPDEQQIMSQPQSQRPQELPLNSQRPPSPTPSEVSVASSGVRERVAVLERSVSSKDSPVGSPSMRQQPAPRSPSVAPKASAAASPIKSAEVEEFKRDEVEQNTRILISGVIDTLDNSTLTLQEAISKGIVHSESGSYLNRFKNAWIPIPVAVAEGLIIVEHSTDEQREVKKQQSYGIITIKNAGGGRAFVVTAVNDRLRRSKLSPEEAQQQGLANESLKQFLDTERDEWLDIAEAADRGIIEYDVGQPSGIGADESVSYVVYNVVDVANRTSVTFKEASELGLIDTDEGTFVDSRTRERLEFDDAIKKGFLKADRMTGPASQVAGAEQRVVVNRFRSARSRIHGALAFQKSAANAKAARGSGSGAGT